MTTKHLADGLMLATRSHTNANCATKIGMDEVTFWRMRSSANSCVKLATFDDIQRRSGIPLDRLMAWYRLPPDATLTDCLPQNCTHRHYEVDESRGQVLCADCREPLNPIWVLLQLGNRSDLNKIIARASA